MNEMIANYSPLILDFMVISILACGAAIQMHRGLYNALMPLAVIGAAAVCGLTLSSVLTGPISTTAAPALTQMAMKEYDYSLLTVENYDAILARIERGMTDEAREALNIAQYTEVLHNAARDAGDKLATVNEEVLTDENIDSAVSGVEDTLTDVVPEAVLSMAREALEEKGLTGDAAREYIRTAGDVLGSAKDTLLT